MSQFGQFDQFGQFSQFGSSVPAPRYRSPVGRLAPLIVGGALLILTFSGRGGIGQWLRGFFDGLDRRSRQRSQRRTHSGRFSPTLLRQRILGQPKATIAAEFGPPRTAVFHSDPAVAQLPQTVFWRGDTWYYAIDPRSELAMAVLFENDEARAVEFFHAPSAD